MNRSNFFCLLLMACSVISCKEEDGKYYLKDKWKVKALPTKVFEYFYRGIEDINIKQLPLHGSYESFTYNDDGDLLEYKFHLSKESSMLFRFKYTDEGYTELLNNQSTTGFEEKPVNELKKTGDNKYKETEWYSTAGKKWSLVSYKENGNKIIKEQTIDGTGHPNSTIITSEYDGQRLLKQTIKAIVDDGQLTSVISFSDNCIYRNY
ncbi:MAG TPA: hypothetical protein VK484_02565 [Ferruginibacter sp.]|nr:hypothetical protein [Ferruginibacter sp.]